LAQAITAGRAIGREIAPELNSTPWAESGPVIERGLDRLHAAYGHLHWVHVLNNAATIALALEAGGGDHLRSVALGVMTGWDTDSVGATIGAVTGALGGPAAVPQQIARQIGGVLHTSLPGGDTRLIDELVDQTLTLRGQMKETSR
nr:ADP-ribosylglycohydrolase family protein [Actinomycetales bacterium]